MVECEFSSVSPVTMSYLVLIDTWWNVNQLAEGGVLKKGQVLIDTWWNVNKLRDTPVLADRIVLIDTWWNVNYDVYEIEELATGFNRYMVECECGKIYSEPALGESF